MRYSAKSGAEVSHPAGAVPQILVVDDHELTRRAVRGLLERQDCWLVCGEAANGQEAVDKAGNLHPDVIVMDVNMPGMNGLEAAQRIATVSPHSRVVLFTMHGTPELARRGEDLGISGLVNKENAARELPEAVEAVLHGKHYFRPWNYPDPQPDWTH